MSTNGTPPARPAQAIVRTLIEDVRAYLEYQRDSGLDVLPVGGAQPQPATHDPKSTAVTVSQASMSKTAATSKASLPEKSALPPRAAASDLFVPAAVRQSPTLEELRAEIGDCKRCKLAPGRTHLVFGVGNPNAQLMFVGEGPGRDEDLKGEPFVGRAGQLLTEIITKGMKMRRADVYIANVIKCRPPENRNPEADEIAACQPFLQRQIEVVRPKVLVALGTFAAQTLLGLRTPISRLRGHWYDYHGIKLMPTLHPAYLLRNPSDKRLVWEDIKMVLRELELNP